MEWLDDLRALAALALCALAPGFGVVALVGVDRRVPRELAAPLMLLATVLAAAPIVVLQLARGVDGGRLTPWWGVISAIGLLVGAWARRRERRPDTGSRVVGALALGAGALGFVVGGLLHGDAMYHASYAERLAHLSHPGFATSQQFLGGSPHEGYLVPAWHFLVAQAALLAGVPVIEVMRVGPALTVPLMVLAFAALGRALFGSSRGAAWAAVGFVIVDVLRPTSAPLWAVSVGMWPGSISLWVALPAALTLLFVAVAAAGREPMRRLPVLAAGAGAALVVLHVTYLLWMVGFVLVAFMVLGIERGARRARIAGRPVLVVSGALVGGAGAALASYLLVSSRVLTAADGLPTGASSDDREFFAPLLAGGDSLQVALHVFAAGGATTMVGMLGAAAIVVAVRARAAAIVTASVLTIIVASRVGVLASLVAHVAGLSHTVRLPQALPVEVGIAGVCALATAGVALVEDRSAPLRRRAMAAVVLGIAIAVMAALSRVAPALRWRFDSQIVPDEAAAVLVFGTALLAGVSLLAWQWMLRRGDPPVPVAASRGSRAAAVAGVLLISCGLAPSWVPALAPVPSRARELDAPARTRDLAGELPAWVYARLQQLPQRSVVLVGPVPTALVVPAIAPVYVAAYPKLHTADTKRNRRTVRIALVRRFTFIDMPEPDRNAILHVLRVQFVLVPSDSAAARAARADDRRYQDVHEQQGWLFARVRA